MTYRIFRYLPEVKRMHSRVTFTIIITAVVVAVAVVVEHHHHHHHCCYYYYYYYYYYYLDWASLGVSKRALQL